MPRLALVCAVALLVGLGVTAASVGTHTSERPTDASEQGVALATGVLPEPTHHLPAQCLDRVALATLGASALAWSPDGAALAVTTSEGGRDQVIVLRGQDWTASTTIAGRDARWSANAKLIAVARGADVVIVDATLGKDVGSVAPAAPGYGWSGGTLLYWDGTRLRGWQDGRTGPVGAHVPDITPLSGALHVSLSADGSRYALRSPAAVMYGDVADGRLSLLPRVASVSWSAFGSDALLDFATGERGYLKAKLVLGGADLPPVVGPWSPDGSQILLGPSPSGPAWDLIGWAGTKNGDATRISSGLGSAAFAPTGVYLAGIRDAALELFRCGEASGTATYISRARAKQLIDQTGDLLKVNISDSKLVRWGDVSGTITGDWAVRDAAADRVAPTDLVWLLMYAGEARRPDGVKWDQPTVNLILYVIDARDGTRLARRIANGTWWIGAPLEGLVDRAPDPTAHPFAPQPGATNPITMPTPRPTATLATSVARSGLAHATSAGGGWSVDYPDGWWTSRDDFAGATFATRDPSSGQGGTVRLPGAYDWASTLVLQTWWNPDGLDANGFADQRFADNFVERAQSRGALTIAGRDAVTIVRRMGPNPPDNSFTLKRYWIVPTPKPDRMLVITASAADSVYASEFDRVVASLAFTMPQTRTGTPDISKQQVLAQWAGTKTPPARLEAKLVPYGEVATTEASFAINPLRHDLDELVWVVAIAFTAGDPRAQSGRGLGPTPPARWQMYVTPAYADDTGEGGWGQSGSNGDWPAFFEALIDRCC